MVTVYSLALFIVEQIIFLSSLVILLYTFKQTKFEAHITLATAFLFLDINSLLRFITVLYTKDTTSRHTTQLVTHLWEAMNVAEIIGLIFVFYAFIYFKTNKFHPVINIVSFIGGALIFTFVYPDFTTIKYNEVIGTWEATYSSWVTLLIIPVLLFFVVSFILPIYTKFTKTKDKAIRIQLFIQLIGLTIVLIWAALAGFTTNAVLRSIRPFLHPFGWLVWSITLIMDPFNIMVSNATINQLLITNITGLPIYYNDFTIKDKKETPKLTSDITSGLISGVKDALEKIMQQKSHLSIVVYNDQVIGITSSGYLQAFIFGERFDKTLEIVLNVILKELQESPSLSLKVTADYVDLDPAAEKIIKLLVEQNLKRVILI